MIETTYTLSEPEYFEAQQLYLKSVRRWGALTVNGFSAFLLVCFSIVIATNPAHFRALQTTGAVPGILLLAFALSLPWLSRRALKKRYLVERSGLTDIHVMLTEEGYRVVTASQGAGDIPWTGLSSYIESQSLFLLLQGFTFRAIPKRALDEGQITEVRRLITTHLPKPSRAVAKAEGR